MVAEVGLLRNWTRQAVVPESATAAGWWTTDPFGAVDAHWRSRLGSDALVIDLDHAAAEAALGMPGNEAELVRLLNGPDLVSSGHRLVALHTRMLADHGRLLYVTRYPCRFSAESLKWLVAAARAGGSNLLCVVARERDVPLSLIDGDRPALLSLPGPEISNNDMHALAHRSLTEGVPLFAQAAFAASVGGRVDLAELALTDVPEQVGVPQALLSGEAGRRQPGGVLDRRVAMAVNRLGAGSRSVLTQACTSAAGLRVDQLDVKDVQELLQAGLLASRLQEKHWTLVPATELLRTLCLAHLDALGGGTVEEETEHGPLARLDRANDAMDHVAGTEAVARLMRQRAAGERVDDDLAEALMLEQRFLEAGALAALRLKRQLGADGPLARAMVVRISLETGGLYQTVSRWVHEATGVTPVHRDDPSVLGLLPPSRMRELYIRGLVAAEEGRMRHACVHFGRVLALANGGLREAPGPAREEARAGFEARLFRVTAGQVLLNLIALSGYRDTLARVTDMIVRGIRPWHGALAGAHEMAMIIAALHQGTDTQVVGRLQSVQAHARLWHHGTLERMAQAYISGELVGAEHFPEDVQGAAVRGRVKFEMRAFRAVSGDLPALVSLAVPDDGGWDARKRLVALWARTAMSAGMAGGDPLPGARTLVESGEHFLTLWLVNAALTLDPERLSPYTGELVELAGRCHPRSVVSLPLLHSLVAQFGLSERELDVIRGRLAGEDVRATAERLGLSARTVESYRGSALGKARALEVFGLKGADARRWALELAEKGTTISERELRKSTVNLGT